MAAQNATAEIRYSCRENELSVPYGRWWDREIPLYPKMDNLGMEEIKALKRIDIYPGHPETLILAFKKKTGTTIYGFHFTDNKKIWEKLKKRKIGPPLLMLR